MITPGQIERAVMAALAATMPAIEAHPTLAKITIDVMMPKGHAPVVYVNLRSKSGGD